VTVVFAVVAGMLTLAACITVVRLVRGPSALDRVVALDMLLAITLCGLAATAAASLDPSPVPVLVVVALLGFVGAVSIARIPRAEPAWAARQRAGSSSRRGPT
jgi:multicomponent Na+:H+ antiporter subunit F